jgi:uncharacterized membrane protein YqjE
MQSLPYDTCQVGHASFFEFIYLFVFFSEILLLSISLIIINIIMVLYVFEFSFCCFVFWLSCFISAINLYWKIYPKMSNTFINHILTSINKIRD